VVCVTLGKVHARILIVGAWLLGAGTATAGSLIAVSLLGQGIIGSSSQQLTVAAVNRALASETGEPSGSPSGSPSSAAPEPASPFPSARAHQPSPAPVPSTPPPASPGGTLLSSSGGNAVASCGPGGAYLYSWSPQQGYEAVSVRRGPAAQAMVTFRSSRSQVNMVVTCHGGVPAATSDGDDNNWGDD
jgi:hypothetical protein